MAQQYITCMSIAGSDPSCGAGIQADLKTFSALGVYGTTVPTAITVQNTSGVHKSIPLPAELVGEQLKALFEDLNPQYVKIGMTANVTIIHTISSILKEYRPSFIVLDPIMISSSGFSLLENDAIEALKKELFPLCSLLTPNIPETYVLCEEKSLLNTDLEKAGQFIRETYGCQAVLIKGGHNEGHPTDILVMEKEIHFFSEERIVTPNTHGTGCTLSSAITAFTARNYTLPTAVKEAKSYLTRALSAGANIHFGSGTGPMNHFFAPKSLIIEEK